MLVDSHCHLSCDRFDKDRQRAIERARAAGVGAIIEIGTMPMNWSTVTSLAGAGLQVFAALGLHPHYVKDAPPNWQSELAAAVSGWPRGNDTNKIVAIGEAGLDFYRDLSPRDAQRSAFQAQLQMAADFGLPFVMHARDADAEVLDLLGAWKAKLGRPLDGVWHCFSAGPKEAMAAVGLGLHLGFGGVMTYPRSEATREAARVAPADKLLVETDAPFVTPQSKKGQRNEPAFVLEVARSLAQVRGTTEEDVGATTTSNARQLFGI